jgi:predicted RNA-binding Zn-ribbon protein involved in translation (DUF1610 family)
MTLEQDATHTHECGACGQKFAFPEWVSAVCPGCGCRNIWPVTGHGEFAISRDTMLVGFPSP